MIEYSNPALFTDLYQLTMAYGYWKSNLHRHEATFHLFFRKMPFGGGYALACGLEDALEYLSRLRFEADDLAYLATLCGNDDAPLFPTGFLDFLGEMRFDCDLDAVAEGTPIFAHEPILRVSGAIIPCQLVETALLNIINFQTLIATKAARVCEAAGEDRVLEFGARRAQGPDGALSASRAAYIGGCASTSNVLAGKRYGIPVKGTHAHSWVMMFDDETDSFEAYARAMPNNCVFLVDTYDTLEGVRRAAKVGVWLRSQGHKMAGIRLDSGDLAYLSIEARKILDAAGLPDVPILASNDLDENLIQNLKLQGAPISIWGVGTQLVTGGTQSALGGVYKLAATRAPLGELKNLFGETEFGAWQSRIKISDDLAKISTPGAQNVRRFYESDAPESLAIGDAIYDAHDTTLDFSRGCVIVDPADPMTRRKNIASSTRSEDLLLPVLRSGERVSAAPTLSEIRENAARNLRRFHPTIRRFANPHRYPAGLESSLNERKLQLVAEAKARG